ncbi:hypothetical protein ACFL56_01610, partial [Candidatus Margulisiibacteriota bacterium]
FSWSAPSHILNEKYKVDSVLDLQDVSNLIVDASQSIGQTVQEKMGGRRVVDSISSLLVNFDLASVQKFVTHIARTSFAFGGVTTLFVLEEGTVSEQLLNNITYLMDGVLEMKKAPQNKSSCRIVNMKWVPFDPSWVTF